jgi:flagellin
MTSILTNTSSMVALKTLQSVNAGLQQTQDEIATGKKVSSARGNAATWAISRIMETDVSGFKTISDGLNLATSTIAVARTATESVGSLLEEMKTKIVASQGENVDRTKIQADISQLRDQIVTVVNSAQFNGLNLVNGSSAGDISVLASLDRSASGSVTSNNITVQRQDLSLGSTATPATFGTNAVTDTSIIDNGGTNAGTAASVANNASQAITIASVGDGYSYRITLDDTAGENKLGARSFEYVANADDSMNSVAAALANQVSSFLSVTGTTGYSITRDGEELTIANTSGGALSITAETADDGTAGTTTGGLGGLASIDVSTGAGAASALVAIEGLIQTATDAGAAFGQAEKRLSIQNDFISSLTDSMRAGIGSLVDANMEEASARLQALQVQQQLAVQALSIANQSPQNVLSLFR